MRSIKVKYIGANEYLTTVYRDLTVGNVYPAYIPTVGVGEVDAYGDEVLYEDELWLTDDVGDTVAGRISAGFVVVFDET